MQVELFKLTEPLKTALTGYIFYIIAYVPLIASAMGGTVNSYDTFSQAFIETKEIGEGKAVDIAVFQKACLRRCWRGQVYPIRVKGVFDNPFFLVSLIDALVGEA